MPDTQRWLKPVKKDKHTRVGKEFQAEIPSLVHEPLDLPPYLGGEAPQRKREREDKKETEDTNAREVKRSKQQD